MKFTLVFCLLHLAFMSFCERLHYEGLTMCHLLQLPHRGLGALHYAHIMQPTRVDYVTDYLVEVTRAVDEERLLEGQTRPVVPMYAVVMAREYPRSEPLWVLRAIIMHNHFNKLHP